MHNKANLQDIFLLRAKRDRLPVTMFLMNGFQMRGIITGFDAFVVILDSDGRQQVIYKHAISTIAPIRPVEMGSSALVGSSNSSTSGSIASARAMATRCFCPPESWAGRA